MMEESHQRMRSLLSEPNAGAKFSPDEVSALVSLKIDLNQKLMSEMESAESSIPLPQSSVKIPPQEIPVNRSFMDYLLLRSGKRVRKALFGDLENPSKPLSPEVKEKRLGSDARQALSDYLKDQMIQTLIDHPRQAGLEYLKSFVGRFQALLEDILDDHRVKALDELESARRAQRQHEIIEKNCNRLRNDFGDLRKKLEKIRSEFAPVVELKDDESDGEESEEETQPEDQSEEK